MSDDWRASVDGASDLAGLKAAAGERSATGLTAREAERLARRLEALAPAPDLRVLYLGNHTLDLFARCVTGLALTLGVVVEGRVGPFDQHMQAVLDPAGGLAELDPHVVFLTLDLRRLLPVLPAGLAALSAKDRQGLVEEVLGQIGAWVTAAKAVTGATLLIGNFWRPRRPHLGLADAKLGMGEAELYAMLNARLFAEWAADPQVFIVDVDQALATVGRRVAYNARMAHLGRFAWAEAALPELGELLARHFATLVLPPRKCLVLDLDNTLWGGVLGEEGPEGIRVARGDPVGEAFRSFQEAIRAVQRRGFLLALCSKNNPEDVAEVFRLRTDMPLQWADFATSRINWEPKHENLAGIAGDLNIGTDSLVFVDDNPAECELVRQLMPEVRTVHLPRDPAEYAGLLLDLPELERLALTEEDLRKTEQYREEATRKASRVDVGDMHAYLESLGTELTFWPASRTELTRVHQLFAKTNQFNVTTKRYRPAEIERFMLSPDWHLEVVAARDRFGDLGIVGLFLLERRAQDVAVDSVILSCRAMGRGIETAMANRIKEVAAAWRPEGRLEAVFRPTRKNRPAADFFARQGFETLALGDASASDDRHYRLVIAEAELQPVSGLTIDKGECADEPQAG